MEKCGDDPLYSVYWPPVRTSEVQHKGLARVVRDFVNCILDADSDALVMVTGDLNDFQFGEPGEGPDNPLFPLVGTFPFPSFDHRLVWVDVRVPSY